MNRERYLTESLISPHGFDKLIGSIVERVRRWRRNHRTRQQLGRLDDHHLPDLGLSVVDRQFESQKWFWQA